MEYFIFIFYLLLFSSFLYYFNAHKGTGFPIAIIISLFVLKVFAGALNVYIHTNEYVSNDIHFFYEQSVLDLQAFHKHPWLFLNDLLFNWGNVSEHLNVFNAEDMRYLADLGPLVYSKYMNLSNICTMNTMYADVIFFNIIYFTGALQLYKLFYLFQPQKKWLFLGSVFLIPSVLFWCSGIHKDGWVLASLGWICYYAVQFQQSGKWRYLAGVLAALMLLFASRYFVFFCFLPLFLCWWIWRNTAYKNMYFLSAYAIFLGAFFTVGKFTSIEPLNIIVGKQKDFLNLHGYSDMQTPLLDTSLSTFIRNFPTALEHILFRPMFQFDSVMKYQLASIDAWFTFLLIVIMIVYTKRSHLQQLFYIMLIVFGFSMYMFIGYTVPNCGALLRYKSEFTVLLVTAFVAVSEVPFFKRFYASV